MKNKLFLFLALFSFASNAQQITWGGLVDFEIRKGGENSNMLLNQTPNKNWTLFTPNARIFTTVDLNEKWWFSTTLQADYYGQTQMHDVFFSLLNVNYQPSEKRDFTIQAGRIMTPFGYNHKTFLSSDNPFANLSLESSWNLRVDKQMGYIPVGALSYSTTPGQSTVYQRHYTQGISFAGTFGKAKYIDYTLALTTSPASGFSEVAQVSVPSFIGRVVFQPVMWAKIGTSFTHGGYMIRDATKNSILTDNDLASYKQTAYAIDASFNYSYFELTGQWMHNEWNAPYFFVSQPQNKSDYVSIDGLGLSHWLVQSKINLPFIVGAYVAARYENMKFSELAIPVLNINEKRAWSPETNRYEIVLGYKIARNIIGKLSWQDSRNKGVDKDDYAFTTQLSIGF